MNIKTHERGLQLDGTPHCTNCGARFRAHHRTKSLRAILHREGEDQGTHQDPRARWRGRKGENRLELEKFARKAVRPGIDGDFAADDPPRRKRKNHYRRRGGPVG